MLGFGRQWAIRYLVIGKRRRWRRLVENSSLHLKVNGFKSLHVDDSLANNYNCWNLMKSMEKWKMSFPSQEKRASCWGSWQSLHAQWPHDAPFYGFFNPVSWRGRHLLKFTLFSLSLTLTLSTMEMVSSRMKSFALRDESVKCAWEANTCQTRR